MLVAVHGVVWNPVSHREQMEHCRSVVVVGASYSYAGTNPGAAGDTCTGAGGGVARLRKAALQLRKAMHVRVAGLKYAPAGQAAMHSEKGAMAHDAVLKRVALGQPLRVARQRP